MINRLKIWLSARKGKIEKRYYNWNEFCKWAKFNGVDVESDCYCRPWWECWKASYEIALKEKGEDSDN